MATFTPNYNLEKPAPGTQDGAWAATLNDNFDVIDSAIGTVANTVSTIGSSVANNTSDIATLLDAQTTFTFTSVNKTLEVNEKCLVSESGKTITLPASPSEGDQVGVIVEDFTDTIVARNGSTIMGLSEDLTINKENASVDFVYIDEDWKIK